MAHHHAPRSSRSLKLRSAALQWDLDQELKDKVSLDRKTRIDLFINSLSDSTSQSLSTFGGVGGDGRRGGRADGRTGSLTDNTLRDTVLPSFPPTPQTLTKKINPDSEVMENMIAWLELNHINGVNFLTRNYSIELISQAAYDFEQAVRDGIRLKSPTAFFRSLLK